MGEDISAAAARRMRLLTDDLARPRTRSRDANRGHVRSTTPTHAPSPIHVGILDHIRRSVDEVVTHTRASNPEASPAPAGHPEQIYAWAKQETAHLDAERQLVRDALIYRQSLEHALEDGDEDVIRPIPCPECGCWSLFWRARQHRAACLYQPCATDGVPRLWTLAQLAQKQVEKKARRAAT